MEIYFDFGIAAESYSDFGIAVEFYFDFGIAAESYFDFGIAAEPISTLASHTNLFRVWKRGKINSILFWNRGKFCFGFRIAAKY